MRRAAVLAAACAAAVLLAASAPGRCLAARANVLEDFGTDPRSNPAWLVTGAFVWERAGLIRADCATRQAAAWRRDGRWGAGTLSARIRLGDGEGPGAPELLLTFARDPATGAFRWVRLRGGERGSVAVGQSGVVDGQAGRVFGELGAAFPANTWLQVSVTFEADGRIRVRAAGLQLLQVTVGSRPAVGRVGLMATKGRVAVTEFGMVNPRPRPAGCVGCHDGRDPDPEYPLAPDVYRYWDGAWWDTRQGGVSGVQQGGHGDLDGLPALVCEDCHDLTTALARATHLDGVRGGRGRATLNTFHLREEFFTAYPAGNPGGEYGIQVAFDNYCAFRCHAAAEVQDMRHHRDTQPGDLDHGSVELGTHLTRTATPLLMDVDLNAAAAGGVNFSPCVACHDPHGTGLTDTKGPSSTDSNRMLRATWIGGSDLCQFCHVR